MREYHHRRYDYKLRYKVAVLLRRIAGKIDPRRRVYYWGPAETV